MLSVWLSASGMGRWARASRVMVGGAASGSSDGRGVSPAETPRTSLVRPPSSRASPALPPPAHLPPSVLSQSACQSQDPSLSPFASPRARASAQSSSNAPSSPFSRQRSRTSRQTRLRARPTPARRALTSSSRSTYSRESARSSPCAVVGKKTEREGGQQRDERREGGAEGGQTSASIPRYNCSRCSSIPSTTVVVPGCPPAPGGGGGGGGRPIAR